MEEETLKKALMEDRIVEFTYHGNAYLIQQENNKGWDYLSVWNIGDRAICLSRALFDIFDGVDEDTVEELLRQECVEGRTLRALLPEMEDIRIH